MARGTTELVHYRLTTTQLPAGALATVVLERGRVTMLLDATAPPRAVNAAAAQLAAAIAAIPASEIAARVRAAAITA